MRRARRTLLLGMTLTLAVASTRWLRVNVSPSLPYGVYGLGAVPSALLPGTLVVLPAPAPVHRWHTWWVPLLKPVAARAGETVCHADGRLVVQGRDYGPVHREAHGQPLPVLPEGCQVVPPGMVFLASAAPQSLDGRYFGLTPVADVTATATPLVTWR